MTTKTKINRRPRPPIAARAQRAPVRQNEPGLAAAAHRAAVDPRSLSGKQIIQLQRAIGNRAVNRLLDGERSGGIIQAKLSVGAADDAYEREADRVATQVIDDAAILMRPAGSVNGSEPIRTKAVTGADAGAFEVSSGFERRMGKTGSGKALPRDTRAFMESRMGADFGDVRLHTGGVAERLNQDVGAQAFTHGQDIYLGKGAADPASASGKHLLAHELTHTLQQGGARRLQRHGKGRELKHAKEQAAEIERKQRQTHDDILEPQESAPIDPERGEQGAPPKIGEDGFMTPAKVRTPWKKKADTKAATKAAGRFKETQKLTPGAMSLASAQKILQGSLGSVKTIVPGAVQILANQKACSRKYDEVCIAAGAKRENGDDWQFGDCDKDDEAAGVKTQGFAWEGVVYVNGETTLVTATAHEILHNNADPSFRGRVGESLNEGVTETLARQAIKDAGIAVPNVTAYENEVKLTKLVVDFVGMDVVKKAYLKDPKLIAKAYENKSGASWGDVVTAANKLDAEALKKALKTKK